MDRNLIFPRAIRYLMAVAEHKSFTRAAEALYVSQPTLSQQIKQLEDLLDVQLLDRSGRHVRLTAAGDVYLQHARKALNELNAATRAIHELADLSRGSLRIGMTPITDYLATPLLEDFNAAYPNITVSIMEMPHHEIETALLDDGLDIGVTFGSASNPHTFSEDIETRLMFFETLNLAVSQRHPMAHGAHSVDAQLLEELPLVVFHSDYALRRHIDVYCLQHDIRPRIIMEAASLTVIVEMVRLGRLATILPDTIASSQPGLHSIMLRPELPQYAVSLVCRSGAVKSPACRAFGELATAWAAAQCQIMEHPSRSCPAPASATSQKRTREL